MFLFHFDNYINPLYSQILDLIKYNYLTRDIIYPQKKFDRLHFTYQTANCN